MTASLSHRTNSEERTNSLFFSIMETTPMGLLIGAALGLVIAGVFQFIFYLSILPPTWSVLLRISLSAGLAIFFELLAFFFLVATVRDFSASAKREGWIGVGASMLLLAYCAWEAVHISSTFDNDTAEGFWSLCSILGTIILAVRVVELRITLTVTSAYKRQNEAVTAAEIIQQITEEKERISGQLARYLDAEAQMEQERERLRTLELAETERQKDEQRLTALQEVERLRRQLAKATSDTSAAQNRKPSITPSDILKTAFRYFDQSNGRLTVTRERIAADLNISTRTLSTYFPNGTLLEKVKTLAESNQQVSEILEAEPA